MKKTIIALSLLGLTSSVAVAAPTQGNLAVGGASSSGNLDVKLNVESFILVNDLQDIDFGTYSGTALASDTKTEEFCVQTNAPAFDIHFHDDVDVAATGFALVSGANKIDYAIDLYTVDVGGASTLKKSNVGLAEDITGISETRVLPNCNVGGLAANNMRIDVTLDYEGPNGYAKAPVGNYVGSLGIIVTPQ